MPTRGTTRTVTPRDTRPGDTTNDTPPPPPAATRPPGGIWGGTFSQYDPRNDEPYSGTWQYDANGNPIGPGGFQYTGSQHEYSGGMNAQDRERIMAAQAAGGPTYGQFLNELRRVQTERNVADGMVGPGRAPQGQTLPTRGANPNNPAPPPPPQPEPPLPPGPNVIPTGPPPPDPFGVPPVVTGPPGPVPTDPPPPVPPSPTGPPGSAPTGPPPPAPSPFGATPQPFRPADALALPAPGPGPVGPPTRSKPGPIVPGPMESAPPGSAPGSTAAMGLNAQKQAGINPTKPRRYPPSPFGTATTGAQSPFAVAS